MFDCAYEVGEFEAVYRQVREARSCVEKQVARKGQSRVGDKSVSGRIRRAAVNIKISFIFCIIHNYHLHIEIICKFDKLN